MNVKIAFLYSEINIDIYIELLTSYSVLGTYKLNRALYSLK